MRNRHLSAIQSLRDTNWRNVMDDWKSKVMGFLLLEPELMGASTDLSPC